ncbi:hypothetical protein E9K97_003064 [Escherichia coli]|nr:hypothetical protein [Escherichia coli]EEY6973569.1 hypothetical protein [Escherichia coli]EEY8803872.1 hypothetical protein [Escherichia coli]
MARPRKYKTEVPGLSPYFDKRNNKVYWRYRHPITGKNHGLGSIDQKQAEAIAAETGRSYCSRSEQPSCQATNGTNAHSAGENYS